MLLIIMCIILIIINGNLIVYFCGAPGFPLAPGRKPSQGGATFKVGLRVRVKARVRVILGQFRTQRLTFKLRSVEELLPFPH
jgi:hypothetical protein